jgi:hypothetical protein
MVRRGCVLVFFLLLSLFVVLHFKFYLVIAFALGTGFRMDKFFLYGFFFLSVSMNNRPSRSGADDGGWRSAGAQQTPIDG